MCRNGQHAGPIRLNGSQWFTTFDNKMCMKCARNVHAIPLSRSRSTVAPLLTTAITTSNSATGPIAHFMWPDALAATSGGRTYVATSRTDDAARAKSTSGSDSATRSESAVTPDSEARVRFHLRRFVRPRRGVLWKRPRGFAPSTCTRCAASPSPSLRSVRS